ncbi:hypothetical protein HZS_7856 [Henneguya salminicola]|nr:hypothetical protein HZS_7856 [Henneguya salminicola]
MDELLAEIERKRKTIDENEITSNKKYFKRGDILQSDKEKLIRQKAQKAKDQLIAKQIADTAYTHTKIPVKTHSMKDDEFILPPDEVIRRLRAKCLPIRLFGETVADSCHRLRSLINPFKYFQRCVKKFPKLNANIQKSD